MFFANPASKRLNPFQQVYQDPQFKNAPTTKDLPAFPFLVDIELTNACNMRCIFCVQQTMKRPKGMMEWDVFRKVIDECGTHRTPVRFIRLGEPFLHKDILKFGQYVKSKDLPLHITNNGLAITEEHMRQLIDTGVDSLIFSFQGATKEQYAIMRNTDRYDELKQNVLRLIELRGGNPKPFIHISSTMTDESPAEVRAFVDYWGQRVDSVGIGKTNLSRLLLEDVKSTAVVQQLEKLQEHETISKEYRRCGEVYQKLSVDWDGKITCCCSDYDNLMTLGDIRRDNLADIWKHSEELKLYRAMLDKRMHKSMILCSTCYHTYDEF